MNRTFSVSPRAVGALAAVSIIAASAFCAPAAASTDFDGDWSVVIVTKQGDCERAYRAPVTISHGRFVNVGVNLVDLSGKVGSDGRITVRVSRGDKSAVGMGRLTSTGGQGSWKGGACAGVWTAERR